MTSSSERSRAARLNIPPPPGSKAGPGYSRIIPREELVGFQSWQPGAFGAGLQLPGPASAPAGPVADEEPTADEWQQRVADARKHGYQDGYRDGLVGLDNFKQAHAAQTARQVGELVTAFDQQLAALEPAMARTLALTAVRLARRVLRHELTTRPETVASLAQEAVQAIMLSARRIEVQVHPDDRDLVELGAGEVLVSRGARLVADPSVARGGCRVESDVGAVDASLDARWAQAAALLGSDLPLGEPPVEPER